MTLRILDGGLGSELEERGFDLADVLWAARLLRDEPEAIEAVHRSYVEAGADVLVTATYQASFGGFRAAGLDDATILELFDRSVKLARRAAAERDVIVAASVGPYGGALADGSEFRGDYDLDEEGLVEWHRQRFVVLASSGADMLACETIPSLAEACALSRLIEEHAVDAWVSFSCRDESRISDGTRITHCAERLQANPRVVAIGINCTPPERIESLIREVRHATDKTIVVYPNAGRTWDAASKSWHGPGCGHQLAELALRWRDAGASWIGGCCGTRPEDIRVLRDRLR